MDAEQRIAELEHRLEVLESEIGLDEPLTKIARLESNSRAHRMRLDQLESARGQAGEGEAFKATQYHQADGGLLPCGHYHECLEVVDQRELECGECHAAVPDDTWMCGLCYPHGALKCGHAIEMQRDGGVCVECRLEDQLEKVAKLAAERDAAILEMGARDNEIYKLSNILLVCYGGPVQGETACEMAARLLKELKAERDAAVRSDGHKANIIEVQRNALARADKLYGACEDLASAQRIIDEALVVEMDWWRSKREAAIREIVALVGEEAKT